MKQLLMLVLAVLFAFPIFSQNRSDIQDFGTYRNDDFNFSRFDPDTLAEAVFMFDIGKSFFEFDTDNGQTSLHFQRRFKIKILSKAGFGWGNIEIPLRKIGDRMDEIMVIKAITYTDENGRVRLSKLDQNMIFKEDRNSNWRIMKFAMPDVQVGSMIDVMYEVKSPFMFFFHNWEFQKSIPVLYSEYTAAMVPFYNYSFLLQGRDRFDEQTSGETMSERNVAGVKFADMLYTFVIKNIAAFRSEPFITCPEDYMIKLNFQLCEFRSPDGSKKSYLSTWPKFCNTMLSSNVFGKKITEASTKSKSLLKTMTLPDSLSEKSKFIYDWVVSSFKWNGDEDKYSDVKVANLLKTRSGSTADINLFLTGMLKAAGVEAFPVLISTRDHGKFKVDAPFDFFFNYVVTAARINGKYILMDATEPTIGYGDLPIRCINEKGFLIRTKKEFDWITLNDGRTSMENYIIVQKPIVGADSLDCLIEIMATGHFAMKYRETYQSGKKAVVKSLLSSDLNLVDPMNLKNETNPLQPFEAAFKAKSRQLGEEGTIWVKPFLGFVNQGNPLKKPTRQYPIDMIFRQGARFNISIQIPEGFELSRMPSNPNMDDKNFKLSYSYSIEEKNVLLIKASYEFKKEIYEASEYSQMRNYFRLIDQVFNQSLVLVKK